MPTGDVGDFENDVMPSESALLPADLMFTTPRSTLLITDPQTFSGAIKNFAGGDTLDLGGIGAVMSATLGDGNVVTVQTSNGTPISLQLDPSQSFAGLSLVAGSDGVGGTDLVLLRSTSLDSAVGVVVNGNNFTGIGKSDGTQSDQNDDGPTLWVTDGTVSEAREIVTPENQIVAFGNQGQSEPFALLQAPPCFAAGTRIFTEGGEVCVEDLVVGDRVCLRSGQIAEVMWLDHRYVDYFRHPRPETVGPIRVQAGAFGKGLPHRDLRLSPDHAVIFDNNMLIPVRYLVNGSSIAVEPRAHVTYWHVELVRHAALLAEGLPCESYLNTGNRIAFSNWRNWPALPFGTWATLVEATAEDIEEWPEYGVATVILYPPNTDPTDPDAIREAPSCLFRTGSCSLGRRELECVTEGLKADRPVFLYFDDRADAMSCFARLRALGCADGAYRT